MLVPINQDFHFKEEVTNFHFDEEVRKKDLQY